MIVGACEDYLSGERCLLLFVGGLVFFLGKLGELFYINA